MREIKFKAWHTKKKKMFSCEELVRDQMTLLANGKFINVSGSNPKLSQIDEKGIMIPLQYIGLKDKNGVEIYRGDILKYNNYDWENGNYRRFEGIGYVNYFDFKCGYMLKVDDDNFININLGKMKFEIIGNIYENPELLEDKC